MYTVRFESFDEVKTFENYCRALSIPFAKDTYTVVDEQGFVQRYYTTMSLDNREDMNKLEKLMSL